MMQASASGRCRFLTLCVVLLTFLILSACGKGVSPVPSGQTSPQTAPPVPTVTISASAPSIAAGGSVTLTVVATNATQVVVADNCDSQTATLQATGGTQTFPVPNTPGTCTYTATASGAASQTAAASVPITVLPSTATTVSMTASAPIIAAGQPVTLTVTVANANSVYITNNVDNTSVPVSAGGGTVPPLHPAQTMTYTVTATGASSQTAQAQVTVTVMTVSITAAPNTIVKGNSTTLTVTAANATQVVISDNVDGTTDTLPGTGGTYNPSPTATTIYTATATSGSVTATATATATATVTVHAAPSVALIKHFIFLMQENHTFDTYFGMLNQYRPKQKDPSGQAWNIGDDGNEYDVDGIVGTASGAVVGNFPTPNKNIPNPNPNISDPVICPASGLVGTTPCTPFAVVTPATPYSLFKLATACVDDMTSDWVGSYGDVSRYDFTTGRPIYLDGFVHVAQNYADNCQGGACGSGVLTDDLQGQRAMGYYDQGFLNYYYYMASQFALSDRWFSPVSSKSTPNRIATLTGGTTQGLVYDPFKDDNPKLKAAGLPQNAQLAIPTIFSKLTNAGVSWRIYYGMTDGGCTDPDGDCGTSTLSAYPSITFADFQDSYQYLYVPATKGVCSATTTPSGAAVGDSQNAFCIDTTHIVPIGQYPSGQYFLDIASGTTCTPGQAGNCLPNFAFVEPAYGIDDEHPGSGQSILSGQAQVANMVNALMSSPSWKDSVFFLSYDEGGGPFDHVPPVPNHSNDFTGLATGIAPTVSIPDISSIAVNADTYFPCPANGPVGIGTQPTPTLHCDLQPHGVWDDPGYLPGDAAQVQGFAAQLGFRLPNMVISPFTRRHYVSHIPMDHTAVIKFVESRFIGPTAQLTNRDAAQPNLLDFFDFVNVPWAIPPTLNTNTTPPPTPVAPTGATCTPGKMQ